jgi:two-component sensor histidine kinase/ligand-binding sensor domain-containing protein
MEDGLSARESYCGLQDSKGFIWFGTRNGLNRYDGKAMLLFTKRNRKMQENNVVKLASDMDDQLFILYGQSGYSRLPIGKVDVLDGNTLEVKSLTETFKNLPFKETDVYWIANDGTERINIMTKAPFRLWEYTKKNGFKLRLEMKAWDGQTYKYNVPSGALSYFSKDAACLGFGGHGNQYIIKQKTQSTVIEMSSSSYKVINAGNDKGFLLWQNDNSKSNGGLFIVDAKGQLVPDLSASVLKGMVTNGSLPINISGDTVCLFNIPGKGLFLYNNVSMIQLLASAEIKDYASLIFFESFLDKLGNVWVCSSGGIYKIKIKKNNFKQYFTKEQQKLETNNQARGIWVDKQGAIYSNVLKHLFIQKNDKIKSIPGSDIKYAIINQAGKIYVTGKEVYEYLPNENRLKIMPGANNDRYIISAIFLNDSIMLLGKTEQVFAFNIKSNTIKQIQAPNGNIILPYRFLKRKDGNVWIAGENGLFLLNSNAEIIDYFCVGNKKLEHELPIDNLTDAFEDKKGTIWLTTNGDGLYRWNRTNNSFKHYGLEEGMPSSILYRIEEDEKKNLWISSENGLVCFDPNNGVTNVLLEKDGLSHSEFNRLSSYKSEDGRMFFGGLNGINAFYPNDISRGTNADAIPLRVISYHQFREQEEKLVDMTASLLQQNKILLKPDDQFFILEFRLLDFESKVNHYAYKLDGVDKDWIYTTDNTIRLSGLPHGKFRLLIKSQTPDGQWSKQQLEIPVEVQVPLYKKGWAQLLFAGIIIIGFIQFFRYRTSRLKKDKLVLEQAVGSRTALLKKTLTEKELLLKEIHHRVKNNLQIISGLLDLQKDEIVDDGSKAIFNEGQSRVKSIALIHQSLYQNDDLAEIKLASFVQELVSQVAGVFEKASSNMQIEVDIPEIALDIDTAVPLGLIINELLTNTFKYAVIKTGKVRIQIMLKQKENGIYLLTFSDNGPGIKQGIDFGMASTLGLRLIKGLAAQLNGTAEYCYDNGSTFLITFKINGSVKE